MVKRLLLLILLVGLVTSCDTLDNQPEANNATPVVIVKALATVYMSPTPNAEQAQATRFAVSPTPTPAPPTPFPSPTPYVGEFIGEAEQDLGMPHFTEPIFQFAETPVQATLDAGRCFNPIAPVFLDAWSNNLDISRSLRCPIQQDFGFFGFVQVFSSGVAYYREETREVWAILPRSGGVGRYVYVDKPAPTSTDSYAAPSGLIVPTGDIGSVWGSVEGLAEDMGYALTPRQRIGITIQRYDGGLFLLDQTSGELFALMVNGDVYGPFTASEIPNSTPVPTATPE